MVGTDEVERLYRRYGVIVYRRLLRGLRSEEDALDGTQEVFLRVLRHGGAFRHEAEAGTWVFRITTNYLIDVLRARRRHEPWTGDLDAVLPPAEGRFGDRLLAVSLLARCPETTATIALLYHVEEMTQQEVAEHMGLSRKTVNHHLSRFLEKAREMLAAERRR